MHNIGWIFVIIQFACIIYLVDILPILQWSYASIIQFLACFLGAWAVYESRKGRLGILPEVLTNSQLINSGPYKKIRHPMYSSLLLFFLPGIVAYPSWKSFLVYIILLVDLIAKLHYEEKLLIEQFPNYTEYQKKTFRLIPYVY